jgi:hypothetical protein
MFSVLCTHSGQACRQIVLWLLVDHYGPQKGSEIALQVKGLVLSLKTRVWVLEHTWWERTDSCKVCSHLHMHAITHVCVYLYASPHMYERTCVCMHAHTHTHTHTHTHKKNYKNNHRAEKQWGVTVPTLWLQNNAPTVLTVGKQYQPGCEQEAPGL